MSGRRCFLQTFVNAAYFNESQGLLLQNLLLLVVWAFQGGAKQRQRTPTTPRDCCCKTNSGCVGLSGRRSTKAAGCWMLREGVAASPLSCRLSEASGGQIVLVEHLSHVSGLAFSVLPCHCCHLNFALLSLALSVTPVPFCISGRGGGGGAIVSILSSPTMPRYQV